MMSSVDFQWEMTEEGFRRMMAEEQTPDIFGSVRFGEYLVEFRCAGGGYDDDYHVPVTDIYIYGEEGIEEYALANGVPYRLLDEEIIVPKRRTLDSFKRRVEAIVFEKLGDGDSEVDDELVYEPTRSHADWNPQEKEKLPAVVTCDHCINQMVSHMTNLDGEAMKWCELHKYWVTDDYSCGIGVRKTPKDSGKEELRIQTQLGTIVVSNKGYGAKDGYPGVWVGIERKGQLFDVAMIEVDQEFDEEDGEEPLLKCHVYCTDPLHDDPIYDYYANAAEIDEFLKDNE